MLLKMAKIKEIPDNEKIYNNIVKNSYNTKNNIQNIVYNNYIILFLFYTIKK
jgi:hypothetical protein